MSLPGDVLDYLESQGLVADSGGWSRAASYMPPDPDLVLAVYETAGGVPELAPAGSAETEYDEVGFQVRIRGEVHGYEAARARLGAVYRSLHGSTLSPATGDPAYVLVWSVQSGPSPLGLDQEDRPEMTWNFRALRERG